MSNTYTALSMKGVILHGGSGTRLRPLTYTDVKQLLPIAGKPVSEYALQNLIEIGVDEVNIIVGEVGEKEVREYYSNGAKWGVNITYTFQGTPLGIAQAIGLTKEFVGKDEFVVVLGDNYFQNGLMPMMSKFIELEPDALVALTRVENPSQFGIATVDSGRIIKMEEKPREPKSNLAVTGAYFLRPNIFEVISTLRPSWRNELEITEAFQNMLDKGMNIGYATIDGWWKDTGTVDEFLDCNRMVLDKISGGAQEKFPKINISGRVSLSKNVKISGNTRILGPCYIGEDSEIEDCYIGPYSSIGSNCTMKGVEIEDSVIMNGATIEITDGTRITRSLIGGNTIVKPGPSKGKSLRLVVGRDCRIEL